MPRVFEIKNQKQEQLTIFNRRLKKKYTLIDLFTFVDVNIIVSLQ